MNSEVSLSEESFQRNVTCDHNFRGRGEEKREGEEEEEREGQDERMEKGERREKEKNGSMRERGIY